MDSTNNKLQPVRGHFDGVIDYKLQGWAYWTPGKVLKVDLTVDGKAFARATANLLRDDLAKAGIGDGYHAFSYPIPDQFFDGQPHQFAAIVSETGQVLPGGPVSFQGAGQIGGALQAVDGTCLVGWAVDHTNTTGYLKVCLLDNDEVLGEITIDSTPEAGGSHEFRYPLPPSSFDGRVHLFQARLVDKPAIVGHLAQLMPAFATPFDALQRYAGPYLKGYQSPFGYARYESLRKSLLNAAEAVEADPASAAALLAELKQISEAHEALVNGFNYKRTHWPPLNFPSVPNPDVSIVIPAHNKFAITYNCLASLLLAPNRASFEVIVVDDGSADETATLEDIVRNVKVHRNPVAQGFINACNGGAELAAGKYIVMLNNDTEVTANWLDELIWPFEHFENVGMTGAKLINADGTLQEAGGIVWGNGEAWNYGRNGNIRDPRYNYTRDIDYISGACIMLSTELWQRLGGFDEFYAPAYYEDTDLAFRIRSQGLRTVYVPFAEVVHFEGQSNGVNTNQGMKKYQLINAPKFRSRWMRDYRGNGKLGQDVELNKDRNVNYRALVLDAQTPTPDRDAGSYAAIEEMKLLQALGFKLTFLPENMAYMGKYTDALQRMGVECQYAPFICSTAEILEKRGHEFDLVYITRYQVAEKVTDLIRQYAPQAKIILNNADLHFLRELRAAISKNDKELLEAAAKTRDAELAVMRKVDLVLSYNEVEHAVIQSHNLDSTKVAKCPWVVETSASVPGFEERRDIAFLGGFGHYPNLEAVEYWFNEIMPGLKARIPDIKLNVYGSSVTDEVRKFESPSLKICGWVEDTKEVFDSCRVFVAPLLSGAGVKGKVLAAMSNGVPVVLSKVAAEGIDGADGHAFVLADTPSQWINEIEDLYKNANRWNLISENSLKVMRNKYSKAHGLQMMRDAFELIGFYMQ